VADLKLHPKSGGAILLPVSSDPMTSPVVKCCNGRCTNIEAIRRCLMQYAELVATNFAKPEPRNLGKSGGEDVYYQAMQGTEMRPPDPAWIRTAFAMLLALISQSGPRLQYRKP
jgi:hypothetical protein